MSASGIILPPVEDPPPPLSTPSRFMNPLRALNPVIRIPELLPDRPRLNLRALNPFSSRPLSPIASSPSSSPEPQRHFLTGTTNTLFPPIAEHSPGGNTTGDYSLSPSDGPEEDSSIASDLTLAVLGGFSGLSSVPITPDGINLRSDSTTLPIVISDQSSTSTAHEDSLHISNINIDTSSSSLGNSDNKVIKTSSQLSGPLPAFQLNWVGGPDGEQHTPGANVCMTNLALNPRYREATSVAINTTPFHQRGGFEDVSSSSNILLNCSSAPSDGVDYCVNSSDKSGDNRTRVDVSSPVVVTLPSSDPPSTFPATSYHGNRSKTSMSSMTSAASAAISSMLSTTPKAVPPTTLNVPRRQLTPSSASAYTFNTPVVGHADKARSPASSKRLLLEQQQYLNTNTNPNLGPDSSAPGNVQPIFEAESPDELALVDAAYRYGVRLLRRSLHTCLVDVPGVGLLEYEVLHVFPFDSNRKRMSIIVRHPLTSEIILYCKGNLKLLCVLIVYIEGYVFKFI